jgi:hypothetical protein
MTRGVRLVALLAAFTLAAAVARAQEFQPPSSGRPSTGPGGLRVDLIGFSTRAGIDVSGGTALVLGSAVDVAELWSPNVRLRPSVEFSGSGTTTALHVAIEVVYRFQPDRAPAIPYVGFGLGYFKQESGGESGGVHKVWPTIAMGFELAFRPSFNWLLEYHALDRLGRHRFMLGLSTRGGGGD